MKINAVALTIALAAAQPGLADPPRVATDIPPVHSLVSRVMHGIGEPVLVLPPGASPHGYAMRPSEASALADAEVVVWIGEQLTPWFRRALDALSPDAVSLELLVVEGSLLLGYRDDGGFGDRAHAGEALEVGHRNDGDEGEPHGGEHAHGRTDPHAWLAPENAKRWLGAVAAALAEADPPNAKAYIANAEQARAEIDALTAELAASLAPVRDRPFIVWHDAYRYLEHRFGLEAAGAISLGDASPPSPARIAAIRDTVRRLDARCIFAEPQFPQELIETVTEGTRARAAILDPLGAALEPGPGLYPQLMRGLARSLRDCLAAAD